MFSGSVVCSFGETIKKNLTIGRARCIPCSRDRWYVPLGRQTKKLTNNWSSQVYTLFSGSVVCSFGEIDKILSLLSSNTISDFNYGVLFLVISDPITSKVPFVLGSCSL